MIIPAAVAACLSIAAAHYGVSPTQAASIIEAAASTPSADRVGIMGVPLAWMPYLAHYGFDINRVETDPCENVIAGVWILAYTQEIETRQKTWTVQTKIPARAAAWQPLIRWVADKAQIDPALIDAIIDQESGFRPDAVSPAGAIGMMQIMPFNARAWGIDPWNPVENIWAGTWHMKYLIDHYQGNVALALAAYNAGENAVNRYGGIPPFKQTMAYVPSVLRKYFDYVRPR